MINKTVEFINISNDIKIFNNNFNRFSKCTFKCKSCEYNILDDELINHMVCSFEFNKDNWMVNLSCNGYTPK